MMENAKIDVSDWNFLHEDEGAEYLSRLSQNVAQTVIDEISAVTPSWSGTALAFTVSIDGHDVRTDKFSIEALVDQCFYWDMRSSSDCGKFCIGIADRLEAQALRLRAGVAVADSNNPTKEAI